MQKVEDPQQKSLGMTPNFMGFTLIELLVVVLIIGILSAVALPQYQKAVEKSRATQAITLLKSVYQAADAYYLANGTWPTRFDEISIDVALGNATSSTRNESRYNNDWTIGIFNNGLDAGGAGVWARRRQGKYKGATFYIWKEGYYHTGVLMCYESYGTNAMDVSNKGDYCVKLFKSTVKEDDANHILCLVP